MALVLKDRVKETSTTTGTGTFTLAGASTGFQSFSVIGDGNTTFYCIVDSAAGAWEVGIGTYTSSGTTLSRDTILESSNSGSKVSFGAGSKDVFCTYPAEKAVTLDDVQTLSNKTLTNPVINGFTGNTAVINIGSGHFYKDTSGNVGIGTSSPSYKVDVIGASTPTIRIDDGAGSGTRIAGKLLMGASSTLGVSIENSVSTYNDNCSMVFKTTPPSGTITERARIDSSGNLLVGKTTTSVSTAGWSFGIPYASNTYAFDMAGTTNECFNYNNTGTGTYDIAFRYQGATKGYIRTTSTTVSFTNLSDYRLKEDIQPMTGALAKVALLKPCTYKWKADGSSAQGFIAHELQEVCPDAVTGEKDAVKEDGTPYYQGIDTSFLVATLTAAIQELAAASVEQQALITTLTERITALEGVTQ